MTKDSKCLDLSTFERFGHFKVFESSHNIVNVEINRPTRGNCFNRETWQQYRDIFMELNKRTNVKLIILTGIGKNFCTGLDLKFFNSYLKKLKSTKDITQAQVKEEIYSLIREFQDCISAPMRINIPMMVVCHGACIGLALDIVACSFIRYCTNDCVFRIPEIKMGFAPDIGALQRLPKIVNNLSLLNELVLTGDAFDANVAIAKLGLFSRKFKNIESAVSHVNDVSKKLSRFEKSGIEGVKFQVTGTLENQRETDIMLDKIAAHNSFFFSKM